jgi:hypothetical protein
MSNYIDPYEIKMPWFRWFLEAYASIFLGLPLLFYGILNWNKHYDVLPKLVVIMGLMVVYASIDSIYKYRNIKYVIRLDKQGVHHRVIDFIEWKDISEVSLESVRTKYGTNFYFVVRVKNSKKYKEADISFLKHRSKSGIFILPVGINSEKAKIAEITAKSYLSQLDF